MAHSPTHSGCKVFQLLNRRWCISHALELIESDPQAAEFVKHAVINELAGMISWIRIDQAHAATVDLAQPIIVARVVADDGEDCGVTVIDGWHRVHRALTEGRSELPAYLLSAETEVAIRFPIVGRKR